jgi:hypothetical protein
VSDLGRMSFGSGFDGSVHSVFGLVATDSLVNWEFEIPLLLSRPISVLHLS